MIAAFADPLGLTPAQRLAPLQTLRRISDSAMLPSDPGYVPLDDRAQSLIDLFATIGRYGQPA